MAIEIYSEINIIMEDFYLFKIYIHFFFLIIKDDRM